MTPQSPPEKISFFVFRRRDWLEACKLTARSVLRLLYTLAVFGGCTYLVFWRGESGWLYLPASLLLFFRRGI